MLWPKSWRGSLHSYLIDLFSQILDLSIERFDFYCDLFWMAWHWKPAIRKMWSVCTKVTLVKKYLERKISQTRFCCLGDNLPTLKIHLDHYLNRKSEIWSLKLPTWRNTVTLKCLWSKKNNCCLLESLFMVKKIAFSFLECLFSFWRYSRFCIMQMKKVIMS